MRDFGFDVGVMEDGDPEAAAFFKFQAFTTAAVQDSDIRAKLKEALHDNLLTGGDQRAFEKAVDDIFDLKPHQINNIYETNVSLSFAAGQMEGMVRQADNFPFWMYQATLDDHTRPEHRALHGKIFRNGNFTFWPPLGFRCRCTAVPLTARAASKFPKSDMPPAREQRKLQSSVGNSEFLGNKQRSYIKWLAEKYKEADSHTRALIDKASDTMRDEIRRLDYESFKDSYRNPEMNKTLKAFNSDKRAQKAAERTGLTKGQALRLYAFTDWKNNLSNNIALLSYSYDKPATWSRNQLSKLKKELIRIMDKLPKYEGTVYRNLPMLPDDVMKQYKSGATITWDSFSSASIEKNAATDNAAERPVRFVIEAKTARIIGDISRYPNEKEATFLPGTQLRINKVENINGEIRISAEEV